MGTTIRRGITRAGAVAFAAVFLLILLACLPGFWGQGPWLLFVPVLLAAGLGLYWLVHRLGEGTCGLIFYLALLAWAAGLLWLAWRLRLQHNWDFGRVCEGAFEILLNGKIEAHRAYFLESSNNYFIVLVLAAWFRLGSVFSLSYLAAGIVLNVLALVASVLFLFWALRRLKGARFALFSAVLCFFFSPMVLYSPIFYTDTLSMPFVCFGLFCGARAHAAQGFRPRLVWALLLGLSAGVGYLVKPSAAFILIAIVIAALLARGARAVWFCGVSLACLVAVVALWQLAYRHTPFLDTAEYERYRLPASHYVMMGLAGNGGYNPQDHAFSVSFDTLRARKAADVAEIGARLKSYGVWGTLGHLAEKARFTWADGTYYAPLKLISSPLEYHPVQEWFLYGGAHYPVYLGLATAAQALLLLLMAADSLAAALKRQVAVDVFFVARLCVFGLALFLLVWETRSRYLVNHAPLLALLAAGGMARLGQFLGGRLAKRRSCGRPAAAP